MRSQLNRFKIILFLSCFFIHFTCSPSLQRDESLAKSDPSIYHIVFARSGPSQKRWEYALMFGYMFIDSRRLVLVLGITGELHLN